MTETSIDYPRVIAVLEAQRARIDSAIAAMRELAGMEPETKVLEHVGTEAARPYAGMTLATAAEAYLRTQGKHKSSAEIARALKRGGYKSETKGSFTNLVYSRLFDQAKKNKTFAKQGKGAETKWGLKEWQRNRDEQLRIISA